MESDEPIAVVAEIRRNSDGEVRRYPTEFYGYYIWSEGNFSCDCNRALFFARAIGEEEKDWPCGDDAYSVRIRAVDGRVLYEDDDY